MTFESLALYGFALPLVIVVWVACTAFVCDILIATFATRPDQQAARQSANALFSSIWKAVTGVFGK